MTKQTLRRWWFQAHKWIGLLLAILIVPISLTGAALVWDEAIDRWINPGRYAVSGNGLVAADAYVTMARAALVPGERIVSLTLPDANGPVLVTAGRPGGPARGGPPLRTTLYLDPPTGKLLARSDGSGLMRTFHMLHGSLMLPGVGRSIVGWIGVAMLISCLSGLWLWWPSVGRWTRGLRWRRQPNVDANLHHLFGFWIALPLAVLSLTGAWISFPQVFGIWDGPRQARPPRAQPVEAATLDAQTVIARAQALKAAPVRQIAWPTDRSPDWSVTLAGGARVSVPDSGGPAALRPAEKETLTRLMRRLHDGTGMGIVWQVILFIAGLIPALLSVTGIIMWWRARRWHAELAAKQALAS
jgi:uncharacterized iron-regulated membrane protein